MLDNVESLVKSVTLSGPFNYVKDYMIMRTDLEGIPYRDACDLLAENGFTFSRFDSRKNSVEYVMRQRDKIIVAAMLEISSENS